MINRRFLSEYVSEARSLLSGNVGVMALSWFLFALSGSLVQPFFSVYAKELGASDLDLAWIRTLGMLSLGLSLIPGGLITDYIGRVKTIMIGTTGITIVQFLYALARDWREFAIIWVLDSAMHFYQPALSAIVMDSMPRDKTFKGFILLNIVPSIPWLFMPVVGGILYQQLGVTGVRIGFVLSGVLSIMVLILRMRGFKETYSKRDKDFSKLVFELSGYRPVLVKAFKVYVFTALLWQLAFGVLNTYGAIYAIEVLGIEKPEWGLVNSASTMASIAWSILIFRFTLTNFRKLSLISSILASSSIAALSLPYFFNVDALSVVIVCNVVISISNNIISAAVSTILTRILPQEIRGRAVSFQRIMENVGAAFSSMVAGILYVGLNPGLSLISSSFIGIASTLYLLYIFRTG
ncbi:MFS transporter [Thermosphaera chiliense]|uniref:MFS transporter n=1 Tax=Thermosphaera chiliense TaxID=3402707 RepID=A0A7M1URT8_9CREN|nr:MFS transporter [Thermosphaera aggregans]QOR94163.1 MFS transporter [Thermosphaera aggregans]